VSLLMNIRRKPREETLSRFGRVQDACRQGAATAAGRIAPAARNTRDVAAGRMLAARGRSAPWLRQAGAYVETDLGPRVGGMLSNAAQRVEPPRPARKSRNAAVVMVAAVSAVGLAGALLTKRSNTRNTTDEAPRERQSVPADVDGQVRDHV
jgi:hypothetical protein